MHDRERTCEEHRGRRLSGHDDAASQARAGALVGLGASTCGAPRAWLAELATTHRPPTASLLLEIVQASRLLARGVEARDGRRRAAGSVDRIPKGARSGQRPVEQPTRFELPIWRRRRRSWPVTPLDAVGLALAIALAVSVLAAPLEVGVQPVRSLPTVGRVAPPNELAEARWREGFARGLREAGHVPGQTIVVETRTYTTADQLRAVLDELVRRNVDVIFVGPPSLARAARQATRDIPIVCGSCGDPVENGLAANLASPVAMSPAWQACRPSSSASAWSC